MYIDYACCFHGCFTDHQSSIMVIANANIDFELKSELCNKYIDCDDSFEASFASVK